MGTAWIQLGARRNWISELLSTTHKGVWRLSIPNTRFNGVLHAISLLVDDKNAFRCQLTNFKPTSRFAHSQVNLLRAHVASITCGGNHHRGQLTGLLRRRTRFYGSPPFPG